MAIKKAQINRLTKGRKRQRAYIPQARESYERFLDEMQQWYGDLPWYKLLGIMELSECFKMLKLRADYEASEVVQ